MSAVTGVYTSNRDLIDWLQREISLRTVYN